jgi:leucine dehydrogenase
MELGEKLHNKDILYAPDYVINAGGLIFAHALYANLGEHQAFDRIENIYQSLLDIFKQSKQNNIPTSDIADRIAKERIDFAQKKLDQGVIECVHS